MRVLVLGGTQFIGRAIVLAFVRAGHDVAVLTRGKSADDLPAHVHRFKGDRDGGTAGLAAVANTTFDACIDVSGYLPKQVRPAVELLHKSVQRYLFISTGAVYAPTQQLPVLESHARLQPAGEDVTEINGETYGPLKVTCENIVTEIFAERASIVRPQIVAGPHDPFGRYTRWILRSSEPGPMLAPGDGSDFVQVVDVRDVATIVQRVIETNTSGPVQAAGPRITWREFISLLGAQEPVWVKAAWLRSQGVQESKLPLYREHNGPRCEGMHMSSERARSLGVQLTSVQDTIASVRQWLNDLMREGCADAAPFMGMSREEEKQLMTLAREQGIAIAAQSDR